MESPMGYRNSQIVEELAAEGKITTEHKGVQTFDFAQYSLLKRMAETTADWPLDKAAEEKHMLPRTFTSGWLSIAIGWGMTIPQTIDEIVDIGNEPRNPKREQLAYNRLGKIAKKLESAGLIKCLRNGNVQRKNNAVWLLMLGDDEENAKVQITSAKTLNNKGGLARQVRCFASRSYLHASRHQQIRSKTAGFRISARPSLPRRGENTAIHAAGRRSVRMRSPAWSGRIGSWLEHAMSLRRAGTFSPVHAVFSHAPETCSTAFLTAY